MGAKVYTHSLVSVAISTLILLGAQFSDRWFIDRYDNVFGLYRICPSSATQLCFSFPREVDCSGSGGFCTLWRTAVFLLNFAILLDLIAIIAYLALLYILRQHHYRRHAKGAVTGLVSSACITIVMGIGIAVSAFEKRDGINKPWETGVGLWMAAFSAVCLGITALATLAWGKIALEDGYEELE